MHLIENEFSKYNFSVQGFINFNTVDQRDTAVAFTGHAASDFNKVEKLLNHPAL